MAMESTPDSGVEIKKAVVAPLLAPCFFNEAAAGSTNLSELEQQLLAICAEVVVDRKIGVDEDLFDAGVNSLALVEIHERIEEQFPGRLEVEDLFEMPSVRSLAAHLAATS